MNKLIKRAKKAGKILRLVPFLRLAALNGSIVRGQENEQSDIDILIIARAGRLYTTRFFATFLIALTGQRRHGRLVAGRICLNCYLNDQNPDITPENKKNMAKVAKAYKYMIPLVDDGISRKFFKINKWFGEYQVKGETHSQLLKSHCFKEFPLQGTDPCKASSCHCEYSKQSDSAVSSRACRGICVDRHANRLAMIRGRMPATTSCHPAVSTVALRRWKCSCVSRKSRDLWRMPVALFEKLLSGKFGDFVEQKLMNYQIKRIFSGPKGAPFGGKQSASRRSDQIYANQFAIKLHPRKP